MTASHGVENLIDSGSGDIGHRNEPSSIKENRQSADRQPNIFDGPPFGFEVIAEFLHMMRQRTAKMFLSGIKDPRSHPFDPLRFIESQLLSRGKVGESFLPTNDTLRVPKLKVPAF
ncbi:hypothetical protein [Tuwongella immobilis]|uniref:hypothetical protein n=1 Tax=Tuwongella immobilis TaxID=692036 RepID=UPI0013A6DA02|nr:hypothetical protein [Tuwongella immobilis]